MYKPNFKTSNIVDKLSDKYLGTNRVNQIQYYNNMEQQKHQANLNYELQKAVNTNKYEWNKQGMISAGINPLAASNNISNVSSSQGQINTGAPQENRDMGYLMNTLNKVIDFLNPANWLEDAKEIVKNRLSGGKR